MAISDIVALAAVIISIGTNVALYIHLSSTVTSAGATLTGTLNTRFDSIDRKFESIERRLEMIQGDTHQMDIRITKLEK